MIRRSLRPTDYPLLCAEALFQSRFLVLFFQIAILDRHPSIPEDDSHAPQSRPRTISKNDSIAEVFSNDLVSVP